MENNEKKYVWLNQVSENLFGPVKSGEFGEFRTISFHCDESKSGYGMVTVSASSIRPVTNRDGSIVPDKYDVYLGLESQKKKVSVLTEEGWNTITLSTKEIKECYQNYKKDNVAEQETETEEVEEEEIPFF